MADPLSMDDLIFRPVDVWEVAVSWVQNSNWPFCGDWPIRASHFTGSGTESYWILLEAQRRIGLIRLFDLVDRTPRFDLRIPPEYNDRGLEKLAVRWITDHLFTRFPERNRIETCTRADHHPLIRALEECAYVREAVQREAWPSPGGFLDAVGYAILRREWDPASAGQRHKPPTDEAPDSV